MPSPSRSNHLRKKKEKTNLTRPSTSDRQHDKRARKQHLNGITGQGRPLTTDFFNFRSAKGFVSTRPFPPSPAASPKPMPGDHRAPSKQGHGGFLALRAGEACNPGLLYKRWFPGCSNWLCPCPLSIDACWGRLELLPPQRWPYILRCRRCSALYRAEDVSQFPRGQGARLGQGPCGGRVRSLSCHL